MFAKKFYEELGNEVVKIPNVNIAERRQYAAMLVLQEQIMRASEQLLSFAAGAEDFFAKHLEGERGHEHWIRNDLANLGVDWEKQALLPEVVKMVGMQYYHILQGRPIAFLGYLALLESYPVSAENVQVLKELYPDSSYTIEMHAKIDIEHMADIEKQLNLLAPSDQDIVLQNALQCAELYRFGLWRALLNRKQNDS